MFTGIQATVGLGVLTLAGGAIPFLDSLLNPAEAPQARAGVAAPAQVEKRVTRRFNNAPLSEVVKWLSAEGVSFVLKEADVPPNTRITLNLVNQPLPDAIRAIGTALGGHWQRHGQVYTFQKGTTPFSIVAPPAGVRAPREGVYFQGVESEEFKKRIEEMMKAVPRDFDMKAWREGMGLSKDFDPKVWFEGKEFRKITPEERERLRKQLGDSVKVFDREAIVKMRDEAIKMGRGVQSEALVLRTQDIRGLMGSLTKQQWELHERQGYLTPEDLTAEQRRKLGREEMTADWRITVSMDGKTLNLRSKRN
jgi:hypothetical protein